MRPRLTCSEIRRNCSLAWLERVLARTGVVEITAGRKRERTAAWLISDAEYRELRNIEKSVEEDGL